MVMETRSIPDTLHLYQDSFSLGRMRAALESLFLSTFGREELQPGHRGKSLSA